MFGSLSRPDAMHCTSSVSITVCDCGTISACCFFCSFQDATDFCSLSTNQQREHRHIQATWRTCCSTRRLLTQLFTMSSLSTRDGTQSGLMASSSAQMCTLVHLIITDQDVFNRRRRVPRTIDNPAWSHGSFGATWCTFFASVKNACSVWSQRSWAPKTIRRHAVLPRIARSAVHDASAGHVYKALSSHSTACSSDLGVASLAYSTTPKRQKRTTAS